jgi:hypothetical protein
VRLARHRRRRQALRRQRCTARRIGGCGNNCDDNDAQPGRIDGGGKHCDDNDAQPDAWAAAKTTATTTMHSPTAFHMAGVAATYATLARSSTRTT